MRSTAILGDGRIADMLIEQLRDLTPVVRVRVTDLDHPGLWDALVTASDRWDLRVHPAAFALGIPWLPIHTEVDTAVIGPLTMPAVPGCPHCFSLRREHAGAESAARAAIHRAHATMLQSRPPARMTPLAAGLVATLARAELAHAPRPASAVHVILDDLSIQRHSFIPEPLCPYCGGLPDDSRDGAVINLVSRPKPDPAQYRLQRLVDRCRDLRATYTNGVAALIHDVRHDDQGGLATAEAPVTLRQPGVIVPGGGRSWDYRSSEAAAILEALERYAGANPAGKRTVVRASLADLDDPTLDPRALGLHEDESYDQPGGFRRFTPDSVANWVWGFSFAQSRPILVPECCAYFWTHRRPDPAFLYDTTNGCAVGSCLEEAILHAILENAERDAFLLTWYSRIPAARVDLATTGDRALTITAAAITHATGYDVTVFDTTTETGIPCIWAMATHPLLTRGELHPETDVLALFCAAGSHLTPEGAVFSALAELGPQLANAIARYPAVRGAAATMLDDPDKVRTIFDHAALFGDPRAFQRLDFLTRHPDPTRAVADIGHGNERFLNSDLRADLIELIERYLAEGTDVIIVNQTAPEHLAQGLVAVKAIIPGSIPLTYGHRRRRLRNLPRLFDIPRRLGHADLTPTSANLNTLPHPFAA